MEKGLIPISDRAAALIQKVEIDDGSAATILRRRFKLTLAEIAAETGVHEHRLSEMERGRYGSKEDLKKGIAHISTVYRDFLLKRLAA